MVNACKVVEDEPQARLELLPEAPRAGKWHGGIVQDVADEMESGYFARHGSAVDEKRGNDDVGDLARVQLIMVYNGCDPYLSCCLGMLKAERHAPSHIAAFPGHRPEHASKTTTRQPAEFVFSTMFALRLLSRVGRTHRVISLRRAISSAITIFRNVENALHPRTRAIEVTVDQEGIDSIWICDARSDMSPSELAPRAPKMKRAYMVIREEGVLRVRLFAFSEVVFVRCIVSFDLRSDRAHERVRDGVVRIVSATMPAARASASRRAAATPSAMAVT